MEPKPIARSFACLVHNVSYGQEANLLEAEWSWSPEDPMTVKIQFIDRQDDEQPDVEWIVGVDFVQDAISSGRAGHPNISPCLAEVSGEDFVLTLRGRQTYEGVNPRVVVSHTTFDFEQVDLFMRQVQSEAGDLDYSPEVERLIASLPE